MVRAGNQKEAHSVLPAIKNESAAAKKHAPAKLSKHAILCAKSTKLLIASFWYWNRWSEREHLA
jgi:hypothetical protein